MYNTTKTKEAQKRCNVLRRRLVRNGSKSNKLKYSEEKLAH